jgi:Ca2+-binding RTX toxin-like protein
MINHQYLHTVQSQLAQFAAQNNFDTVMATAFGNRVNPTQLQQLRQQWLSGNFSIIPNIQVVSQSDLGTANGAYGASLDTIFLSADFLASATAEAITSVLLEEIGHRIDQRLNGGLDSAGDEGEIFSRLVNGENLSASVLAGLKSQNDHGVMNFRGGSIAVENAAGVTINGTLGNDIITPSFSFFRPYSTANDDTINVLAGNDYVDGGAGNDLITGGTGNDSLYGGLGNDTIGDYQGINVLNGGGGIDTYDLFAFAKDYVLNMATGATNYIGETITDFERVITGSGNDNITGTSGANYIRTGDGNDTLDGGDGDDSLDSGAGSDTVYGGAGNDTVNSDSYMEGNWIYGGDGDDSLNAIFSGNDTIYGGSGNDRIACSTGEDRVFGQGGNDYINFFLMIGSSQTTGVADGGDDIDTLEFSISSFGVSLPPNTPGLNLDMATGANNYNGVTFVNFENVVAASNAYTNDTITGTSGDNYIDGGNGNDRISSGGGNDTVVGGDGNDYVDFGSGNDYLNISLASLGDDTFIGGSGNDSLNGANSNETYDGGTGNDTIYAQGGNDYVKDYQGTNLLDGGDGNDTLDLSADVSWFARDYILDMVTGITNFAGETATNFENVYTGSGDDRITGTSGDNDIKTGAGNDTVDGGNGNDQINLGDGNDYVNITSSGNDTFEGGNGNDYLNGWVGNETYYGGLGNDTIYGQGGDDYITDYQGTNVLDGGDGNDTLEITGFTSNYILNMSTGITNVIGGIARDFEDVFTGSGNDSITGTTGNNVIKTGAGNDTINSGSGNDTVDGGDGNDRINLGDGDDYVNITSLGNDTFLGGNGNDYIDGGNGNEFFYGGAGLDTIYGRSGNDFIQGGDGLNYLDGGDGIDTVDLTYWSVGGSYDLLTETVAFDGFNYQETIANFENLNAGSGNDMIGGTDGNNIINAGAGDDEVQTRLGKDTVYGGDGNDFISGSGMGTYYGGAGDDQLRGSSGTDVFIGGLGNDLIIGDGGNDVYVLDADVDLGTDTITDLAAGGIDSLDFRSTTTKAITLNLGVFTNQLVATGVNITLLSDTSQSGVLSATLIEYAFGGALGDNLTGNSLNNYFLGGAGNDSLKGGAGRDYLTGGVDNDTFYFNGAALTGINTVAAVLGRDTISDFGVGTDKIALSKATFTAITSAVGGAIGSNFAVVNADSLAGGQSAAIVYSTGSGNLFYNANGIGIGYGTNGGNFANLANKIPITPGVPVLPALAATDFVII